MENMHGKKQNKIEMKEKRKHKINSLLINVHYCVASKHPITLKIF